MMLEGSMLLQWPVWLTLLITSHFSKVLPMSVKMRNLLYCWWSWGWWTHLVIICTNRVIFLVSTRTTLEPESLVRILYVCLVHQFLIDIHEQLLLILHHYLKEVHSSVLCLVVLAILLLLELNHSCNAL